MQEYQTNQITGSYDMVRRELGAEYVFSIQSGPPGFDLGRPKLQGEASEAFHQG